MLSDSKAIKLTDGRTRHPVWSPDGNKIAYIGKKSLYTINADGSNINWVANLEEYLCYDLAWSPDGTMLAIGEHKGIYVFDLDGVLITIIPVANCENLDWRY